MRIAVFGGTGFVGGYLVEALLSNGHQASVLVRPGSEYRLRGASRCDIHSGNLDSLDAIAATLKDCDAVIYNVGILREFPDSDITFEKLQFGGARRVIESALEGGVSRLLLMSANGVKVPGTPYQETKAKAEAFALESGLDVTVLRPSVIFGDPRGTMEFATQLHRDMIAPPLPAAGFFTGLLPAHGEILMSPVHAEDVAQAFVGCLDDPQTIGKTYELGGPEALSWPKILQRIASATGRRKWTIPVPIGLMKLSATLLDWLPGFPVTREQLSMLAEGNTADPAIIESLTGQPPRAFSVENLEYLAR